MIIPAPVAPKNSSSVTAAGGKDAEAAVTGLIHVFKVICCCDHYFLIVLQHLLCVLHGKSFTSASYLFFLCLLVEQHEENMACNNSCCLPYLE